MPLPPDPKQPVLSEHALADMGDRIAEYIEAWLQADEVAVRNFNWWPQVRVAADGGPVMRPPEVSDATFPQFMTSVMSHAIRRIWTRQKTVQVVNPEMASVLANSLSDRMPGSLFANQPYTDPLVVFPEPLQIRTLDNEPGRLLGFFVVGRRYHGARPVLCSTHDPERSELWINFFVERRARSGRGLDMQQTRVLIPIGQTMFTVDDAVEQTLANFLMDVPIPPDAPQVKDALTNMVRTALSVLVYLCTNNPDIKAVPSRHQHKKKGKQDKKKHRPPKPMRLFRVGYVLGPALGVARRVYENARKAAPGEGRRQPPHQRRAHMRLFWVGPGRTEPELKFIAPYEVSLDLLGKGERPRRVHVVAPRRGPQEAGSTEGEDHE